MRSRIERSQYSSIEEALQVENINKKREVGELSEKRVAEGLDYLKACGGIYDYHQSWDFGELDSRKIDFLVIPEWKCDHGIFLQVKSSLTGMEEHQKKSRIPCIVVKQQPLHVLVEELMRVLGLSTESIDGFVRSRETACPGFFAQKVREAYDPHQRAREEVLINDLLRKLGFEI